MSWTRLQKDVEFKNYIHKVTLFCSICSISRASLSTLSTYLLLSLLSLKSSIEHLEHLLIPQIRSSGVFLSTSWRDRNMLMQWGAHEHWKFLSLNFEFLNKTHVTFFKKKIKVTLITLSWNWKFLIKSQTLNTYIMFYILKSFTSYRAY